MFRLLAVNVCACCGLWMTAIHHTNRWQLGVVDACESRSIESPRVYFTWIRMCFVCVFLPEFHDLPKYMYTFVYLVLGEGVNINNTPNVGRYQTNKMLIFGCDRCLDARCVINHLAANYCSECTILKTRDRFKKINNHHQYDIVLDYPHIIH